MLVKTHNTKWVRRSTTLHARCLADGACVPQAGRRPLAVYVPLRRGAWRALRRGIVVATTTFGRVVLVGVVSGGGVHRRRRITTELVARGLGGFAAAGAAAIHGDAACSLPVTTPAQLTAAPPLPLLGQLRPVLHPRHHPRLARRGRPTRQGGLELAGNRLAMPVSRRRQEAFGLEKRTRESVALGMFRPTAMNKKVANRNARG